MTPGKTETPAEDKEKVLNERQNYKNYIKSAIEKKSKYPPALPMYCIALNLTDSLYSFPGHTSHVSRDTNNVIGAR